MPRNMVVHRLPEGGLWIHSAIALDDPGMQALESFGEPRVLVVPNRFHRLDAAVYKQRYPKLTVVCPSVSRPAVEKIVRVDGTSEEVLPSLGVEVSMPSGLKPFELFYLLRMGDYRALVCSDSLFNLPHLPGLDGLLFRVLGSTGYFGMTRLGQLLMLSDREAFSRWLQEIAGTPGLRAVVVGHGEPITEFCEERIRDASERLLSR